MPFLKLLLISNLVLFNFVNYQNEDQGIIGDCYLFYACTNCEFLKGEIEIGKIDISNQYFSW